jgi:hypothetical protein
MVTHRLSSTGVCLRYPKSSLDLSVQLLRQGPALVFARLFFNLALPSLYRDLPGNSLSLRIFGSCSSGSEFHGVKASPSTVALWLLDTAVGSVRKHYVGSSRGLSNPFWCCYIPVP